MVDNNIFIERLWVFDKQKNKNIKLNFTNHFIAIYDFCEFKKNGFSRSFQMCNENSKTIIIIRQIRGQKKGFKLIQNIL